MKIPGTMRKARRMNVNDVSIEVMSSTPSAGTMREEASVAFFMTIKDQMKAGM